MTELIGWTATAVFSCSYFFRRPNALRWIQAGAALIWVTYGIELHATPVVVANVVVAIAAVGSSMPGRKLQVGQLLRFHR